MKFLIILFLNFLHLYFTFIQIKLKKTTAKYHSQYLLSLKFKQTNPKTYSSFLEKEISLHQQVLAQKRLATYYGDINVGFGRDGDPSKSMSFKMLFDTGSCEFWIPSIECGTERCLTHTRYTQSMTYKDYRQAKMSIQYLSGRVTGKMSLETIGLGDLVVPNQVIGLAEEVKIPLMDEVIWDGILGLAYPNKNLRQKGIKPLFDNIISQGLLTKRGEHNQFSYYLGQEKGAITFGGADMRFKMDLNEEFKWAPIAEKNYWTITLKDVRKYARDELTNRPLSLIKERMVCPGGCKTIVDTGTYLIYGPSEQLEPFLRDMSISECGQKEYLPNIGFTFRGFPERGLETSFELILTPDDYVLEFEIDGRRDCVIGIGADTEDSGWTLGQVFLKTYYTVFDRDNETIGFVRSNPYPEKGPGELTNNDVVNSEDLKDNEHTMTAVKSPNLQNNSHVVNNNQQQQQQGNGSISGPINASAVINSLSLGQGISSLNNSNNNVNLNFNNAINKNNNLNGPISIPSPPSPPSSSNSLQLNTQFNNNNSNYMNTNNNNQQQQQRNIQTLNNQSNIPNNSYSSFNNNNSIPNSNTNTLTNTLMDGPQSYEYYKAYLNSNYFTPNRSNEIEQNLQKLQYTLDKSSPSPSSSSSPFNIPTNYNGPLPDNLSLYLN